MNIKFATKISSLLLTVILSTGEMSAFSQNLTISGSVRETGTAEPVIGALITTQKKYETTNNSGFFAIKTTKGKQKLITSFIGYKNDTIELNLTKDTVLNIALEIKPTDIAEVVVVGNNSQRSEFGKVSVNMNQLKYTALFMGEQDIFKYFQMLPGVVGGKEGSSDLNIRGGSADQTLILLDDTPIYNQNHAMGFVSAFNGDALAKADLYKSSIPASMGGRLSGIVAMTTKEGNKEEHKQILTIGTLTASIMAEGPLKKGESSYLVSARYFTPHLIMSAVALAEPSTMINYLFADITSKLTFRLDSLNTLSWNIHTGYDAFIVNMNGYNFTDKDEKIPYKAQTGYYWGTAATSLRLATQFSNGTFLNSMIYYTGINTRQNSKYEPELLDEYQESDMRSVIDEIGFKLTATSKISKHSLNYGINGAYQLFKPKELLFNTNSEITQKTNGNKWLITTALFAEGNFNFGKFDINVGLRAPLYINGQNTVIEWEPRIGVAFEMTQKSSLYASFDRNTQPLFSLNRQYGGQPIDFWIPFQDDAIESANQTSIGWRYKPTSRLLFSVESFYKTMNNLYFVSDEDKMLANKGGYELGSGEAYGAEVVAQYSAPKTTLMLSYAYTNSTRMVDGEKFDFVYDTPHNLNLYYKQLTLRRGDRTHYFSANASFRSGMPYIITNEVYPVVDIDGAYHKPIPNNPQYPNVRLQNYFRLDLNYSMEKKLKRGKRVWQVSILNVTNHFNPYMVVNHGTRLDAVSLIPFMPSFSYKRYF